MIVSTIEKEIDSLIFNINKKNGSANLELITDEGALQVFRFEYQNHDDSFPEPLSLQWRIPATKVKGMWKPTADFSKRIEADWELENHESRISIDAPVISLFGNHDENVLCFACSNVINRVEMAVKYREEDNHFYCQIIFFTESKYPIKDFSTDIRIDQRKIHFSQALKETSKWWEGYDNLKPAAVPAIAKKPLYSTWYQFHQNLNKDLLLKECQIAKDLGFESIIIDDGWQTKDTNRGYDYTGDWLPERFPNMAELVQEIQRLGMKVGIWYSVPFCGKKSKAYQKFKGKFLTENHRWAPVFDPRYPEVRNYLAGIYVSAARDWGLDGLKLDFIDDFKSYPETSFDPDGNRDFSSIDEAVDALLTQVIVEVKKVNPDIFIEFRQKYTGPAMRKYGNMLRAFDCPGDYTMNRVRIADIKMLCGDTVVHSDMVTWHFGEAVQDAALHYLNTLFGVPQISVMLGEAPEPHLNMIRFYTKYWNENSEVLLSGEFLPSSPLANYPVQQVQKDGKIILGVFENQFLELKKLDEKIDIINAKPSEDVVIVVKQGNCEYNCSLYNCEGALVQQQTIYLEEGINTFKIPICGLAQIKPIE
ncbi:glycoside hydrolase family 36 protein [Flagellimonas sp. CMM7]|uniref:glycoside hydrolase family 36 protein n=1 Tax=Flagellimonas sp. CMM7 TaxID=2654676 RepID=UPI0013D2334B|nr:glycoside hydrolase family 36 protein [Flagellimonas sp. CMM7]UII78716.1 alpha-galactosidase [Flagellimonas sp. CMM7]